MVDPSPSAACSTIGISNREQNAMSSGKPAGFPRTGTPMTARVFAVTFDSAWATFIFKVRASQSTKIGVAPTDKTEFTFEAKESDGTRTSSPTLIPSARRQISNPAPALDTPIAKGRRTTVAI